MLVFKKQAGEALHVYTYGTENIVLNKTTFLKLFVFFGPAAETCLRS
jgi:hypothetical protein